MISERIVYQSAILVRLSNLNKETEKLVQDVRIEIEDGARLEVLQSVYRENAAQRLVNARCTLSAMHRAKAGDVLLQAAERFVANSQSLFRMVR